MKKITILHILLASALLGCCCTAASADATPASANVIPQVGQKAPRYTKGVVNVIVCLGYGMTLGFEDETIYQIETLQYLYRPAGVHFQIYTDCNLQLARNYLKSKGCVLTVSEKQIDDMDSAWTVATPAFFVTDPKGIILFAKDGWAGCDTDTPWVITLLNTWLARCLTENEKKHLVLPSLPEMDAIYQKMQTYDRDPTQSTSAEYINVGQPDIIIGHPAPQAQKGFFTVTVCVGAEQHWFTDSLLAQTELLQKKYGPAGVHFQIDSVVDLQERRAYLLSKGGSQTVPVKLDINIPSVWGTRGTPDIYVSNPAGNLSLAQVGWGWNDTRTPWLVTMLDSYFDSALTGDQKKKVVPLTKTDMDTLTQQINTFMTDPTQVVSAGTK